MEKSKISIYLAGPISHCSPRQRIEWRKAAKAELSKRGHICIDPAEHEVGWSPYTEIIEIDKSDVVVANLWRESIGTVIGIVQARRMGKPVILLDPNYIESAVLREIVGEDRIVHSLEAAVNKLEKEVLPCLSQKIVVEKKHGSAESLSESKLHNKLSAACSEAGINDALFTVLVTKRVLAAIRHEANNGQIISSRIQELVFEQLAQLSNDKDKLYAEDLKQKARALKQEWERQEKVKDEKRALDQLGEETERLKSDLEASRIECDRLRLLSDFLIGKQQEHQEEFQSKSTIKATNLGEAVRYAREAYQHYLVILPEAVAAADDCPYADFEKVEVALKALANFVNKKQSLYSESGKQGRPPGLREWLREANCPFEYAAHESESTSASRECREARTFTYEGKEYVMGKHLKIGAGSPNEGCRIHFEFLGPEYGSKIIIGHIGRHLKIAGGS
jgi:hypothetical protein